MTIPEIKIKLSIATVLAHYGLRTDSNNKLCCPFHADDTPSLQVYPKTNTWHCFGCGKGTDGIDFIGFKELCTTHEALVKATELAGVPTQQAEPKPIIKREGLTLELAQLNDVFPKMKSNLRQSKDAQVYAKARGLDANAIEIGYNGRTYKDLKHCITFALRNAQGIISGMYGRSIYSPPAEGQGVGTNANAKHYYLKESTGLYPHYPNQNTLKLILTESIIDASTLLQLPTITDNYSILACYGTNRLNNEIQQAIKALPNLQEIIFAFDNDTAGNTAVAKYASQLRITNEQLRISTLELPNKDVNETYLAYDENIFTHLLENRKLLHGNINKPLEAMLPLNINNIQSKLSEPQQVPPNLAKRSHETFLNNTTNNQLLQGTTDIIQQKLNTTNAHKLAFTTDTAIYYIKGGVDKVMTKLTVTLEITNEKLPTVIKQRRYKLDLYDPKQVEKTLQEASEQLQLSHETLHHDIHLLTNELDQYRELLAHQNTPEEPQEQDDYILTPAEKTEAMALANDPNLITTLRHLLTSVGIVGEEDNKVFALTVAISSQFVNPLNCLIQGSSGSGKTNLMKLVCSCIPPQKVKMYTRVSDKMLYHVGKNYFLRKVVCFHDVDSLSEEVALIIRELISNGSINTGISYKDDKGNIATKELIVNGPLTTFACTTRGSMYLDNMTRVLIIVMDESNAQTERIIDRYLQKSNNEIGKNEEEKARKTIENYVKILAPYEVYNPYASSLKLPSSLRDRRRLQMLYIHYVDTITNLFQYQRNITKDGKLIATKEDCALAFQLMFDCILIKLDELDGSLRQLYEQLKEWVKTNSNGTLQGFTFTQREVRQDLNINNQSLKRYINDLLELEYIQLKTGGKQGSTNRYELVYWDDYGKMKAGLKEEMKEKLAQLTHSTN